MTEREAEEVKNAILRLDYYWSSYKKLENLISEYVGTEKLFVLTLLLLLWKWCCTFWALVPGDEVIMPAYTYTAKCFSGGSWGATIKMVDIRPAAYSDNDGSDHRDFEMDYEKLAEAITEKTKVIVPVDLAGICANVEKILEVVNRPEIKVLYRPANDIQKLMGRIVISNDCAHSFGAQRHGKMAGSIADFQFVQFPCREELHYG